MNKSPARSSAAVPSSRASLRIDRCVCLDRNFADLLSLARARRMDLAEVTRETGCGGRCRLCRPYLRRMLATGETVFHQIIEAEAECAC